MATKQGIDRPKEPKLTLKQNRVVTPTAPAMELDAIDAEAIAFGLMPDPTNSELVNESVKFGERRNRQSSTWNLHSDGRLHVITGDRIVQMQPSGTLDYVV